MPRPPLAVRDPEWARALAPVRGELAALDRFLTDEDAAGRETLPAARDILRAFDVPLHEVRVVIIGQDPYPTPGHAIGLSFAVRRSVRPLPGSLRNIARELHDDLGIGPSAHGDLSAWTSQGVLLLNRVLTVEAARAGSHRGRGWEAVTECAIRALVDRGGPLVAILWGKDAAALAPVFEREGPGAGVPVVISAHPSPLSARTGFFGSRPFSRANALLKEQGAAPVDWRLDDDALPFVLEPRP